MSVQCPEAAQAIEDPEVAAALGLYRSAESSFHELAERIQKLEAAGEYHEADKIEATVDEARRRLGDAARALDVIAGEQLAGKLRSSKENGVKVKMEQVEKINGEEEAKTALDDSARQGIVNAFAMGESQGSIARRLGVSQTTVSRIVRNGRNGDPVAAPNGRGQRLHAEDREHPKTPRASAAKPLAQAPKVEASSRERGEAARAGSEDLDAIVTLAELPAETRARVLRYAVERWGTE